MTARNGCHSIIHDPAVRAQAQTRYEAGERTVLANDLGVALTTLYNWAQAYEWGIRRRRRRPIPRPTPVIPGAADAPTSLPPTELGGWWCDCGHRAASREDLAAHRRPGRHLHIDAGCLL